MCPYIHLFKAMNDTMTGAVLLDLQSITDESTDKMTWLFTAISIGHVTGMLPLQSIRNNTHPHGYFYFILRWHGPLNMPILDP